MKKNGFVTSAFLYGMLALFIVLMLSTLAILANRKISMDNLKEDAIRNATLDPGTGNPPANEEITGKTEEEKKDEGLAEDETPPDVPEGGILPDTGGKRYIYHGLNPHNYIKFNRELWRIMAIEPDGKLKIIKDDLIAAGVAYDEGGSRTSDYCYNTVQGCNIWGSNTNTFDSAGNALTSIPLKVGATTTYALPNKDATMNIYLNTTYYNELRDEAKVLMDEGPFNVGAIVYNTSQDFQTEVSQVSSVQWIGKVGIIDATEYVKASDKAECQSFSNGGFYDVNGAACKYENYLYIAASTTDTGKFWQTLTPQSGSPYYIYSLRGGENGNDGYLAVVQARLGTSIRPVVYLKSEIKITDGDGTKDNPYIVELM